MHRSLTALIACAAFGLAALEARAQTYELDSGGFFTTGSFFDSPAYESTGRVGPYGGLLLSPTWSLESSILTPMVATAPPSTQPVINSFTPHSDSVGKTITITGENLDSTTTILIGGIRAEFTILGPTQVQVIVPERPARGPISIVTRSGGVETTEAFTTLFSQGPPSLYGFTPLSGPARTSVSIKGENFYSATAVIFNQTVAEFLITEDNRILATVPGGATTGLIQVETANGSVVSQSAFEITAPPALPAIASFSPASGGEGAFVEIQGANLSGAQQVLFNGSVAEFNFGNGILRAQVPATAFSGPLSVKTAQGLALSAGNFTVVRPGQPAQIESFSLWRAHPGQEFTMRGSALDSVREVRVNGVIAPFRIQGREEIVAAVPQGAASGPVSITTDLGTTISPSPLIVPNNNTPPPPATALRLEPGGDGAVNLRFEMESLHPYVVEAASSLGNDAQSTLWAPVATVSPAYAPRTAEFSEAAHASVYYRVAAASIARDNWDFEFGLAGWTNFGSAFERQPIVGAAYLKEFVDAEAIVANIGGDYWNTTVHLGHHGDKWVGTGQYYPRVTPAPLPDPRSLDAQTGMLSSRIFRLDHPWLTCLIGGRVQSAQPILDTPRIELLVRPTNATERAAWAAALEEVEPDFFRIWTPFVRTSDNEMMRREVFAVGSFLNHSARIRIVDPSTTGHINVDDFRFPDTDPTPDLIRVGGIYRDPDCPVWGFADTHTHPASNLGFGGQLISGSASSAGGPENALHSCEREHGINGSNACFPLTIFCTPAVLLSEFTGSFGGHATSGYQHGFAGWPSVTEQGVHQQMYVDWIKRAWQGGLRLMVAHVVNNKMIGDLNFSRTSRDDMQVMEAELSQIKLLVSQNSDFMAIAKTPREARAIIHRGKLAVILGIEEDRMLLRQDERDISAETLRERLDYIYNDLGVRHVFPVHFADNAYGGFAMYNDLWIYNSWWVNFLTYPTASTPASLGLPDFIDWKFDAQGALQVASFFEGVAGFPPAPIYPAGGVVNVRGLQPTGTVLIQELMRRAMIIDIDHMSLVMKRDVFNMLEAQNYPAISGHCGFTELSLGRISTSEKGKLAHEADLTPSAIARLKGLGGMASPITLQKDTHRWNTRVINDAPGTVKSWAQGYQYAVEKMGGTNVGLATDFGLVHGSAPRFGMKAMGVLAHDEKRRIYTGSYLDVQTNGVRYADPFRDYRDSRFIGPNTYTYAGTSQERWESIAMFKANADPDDPATYPRARTDRIKHTARGLFTRTEAEMEQAIRDLGPFSGEANLEIRAGYYVRNGLSVRPEDDPRMHLIHGSLLAIWNRWAAMEGNNRPMRRCTMNAILDADPNKPYVKEWDINLDGMAHYGLLPDFLQDAKNVGLDEEILRPLFSSAEDYIRLWERCERNRFR